MRTGTRRTRTRILIAGLGNEILRDDGVGIHAVRAIGQHLPRRVRTAEVGTAVLDALHLFEWADKVLAIDAVEAGGNPGAIFRFDIRDAEQRASRASLHELDLVAALRFLPEAARPEVTILGIEPGVIEFGLDLSPQVRSSLAGLVRAANDIVTQWERADDLAHLPLDKVGEAR